MNDLPNMPNELIGLLDGGSISLLHVGRVGNMIYEALLGNGEPAILKHGRDESAVEVRSERVRLEWFNGRGGAPRVLYGDSGIDGEWLLYARVPGRSSHEAIDQFGCTQIVIQLANALSRVHAVPMIDCPFKSVVPRELIVARGKVESGLIDEDGFFARVGCSARVCIESLELRSKDMSGSVCTHGDFAMPNVILDDDGVGVIDWSQAGVSDPNRDLMSIEQSITRNLGKAYIEVFYRHYAGPQADSDRIRFFWELDQYSQFARNEAG